MNYVEKVLRDNYTEAREKATAEGIGDQSLYTLEMLWALRDMAKENVYPDGTFGDTECCVWEMFRFR